MRGAAPSIALVALFLASTGGKLATSLLGTAPETDHTTPGRDLLHARGMTVTLPAANVAPQWIVGRGEDCRVRIAVISPQGWSRAIVRHQALDDTLSFAFSGRFYDEQPVVRTRMENYRARLMRYFGMPTEDTVVRAVTVSPGCPADIIRPEDAALLSP